MEPSQATAEPAPTDSQRRALPRRRRWAFRLAAIALSLLPLVAFEGVCRLAGWGQPAFHADPLVGFREVRPLFVLSDDGSRREIPAARLPWFCHDEFAVPKPANEYRAFVLGGSTVQGHPFARETAFTAWLEIALAAADPTRDWQFVNCGGVSYATYRLLPILEEVLEYEPDLIILYTGHNEFLESRSFDHLDRGPLLNVSVGVASRLRTFNLLREGYLRANGRSVADPPEGRTLLPTEVEALLDYRGGLETYHRDPVWHDGVVRQYEFNLRRMVELCRQRGVEVLLINPVSKWRDCPPFKSEHAANLSAEETARWEDCIAQAGQHLRREHYDPVRALELYQEACRIDPLHAGGHYNLAECHLLLEETEQAKSEFLIAKEEDVCPLRILAPMNEAVLAVARDEQVPVLDAQALFESRSDHGITGADWLVDHVHPKIEGHQLLANEIATVLIDREEIRPASDWQALRDARYQKHFDALDPLYFQKGMQRLKGLTDWAAGRARQLRPADPQNQPQVAP